MKKSPSPQGTRSFEKGSVFEKGSAAVKKGRSLEDEWEEELERRGANEMIASVIRDDDEELDDERESIKVEDEESEVEIESLQEVKNLILHQLVISYNLSKVTQHVVDRVLNHLSREEKMEKSLRKIEEVLLDLSSRVEDRGSNLLKIGTIVTLILKKYVIKLL